jgi:hypothetical protein
MSQAPPVATVTRSVEQFGELHVRLQTADAVRGNPRGLSTRSRKETLHRVDRFPLLIEHQVAGALEGLEPRLGNVL